MTRGNPEDFSEITEELPNQLPNQEISNDIEDNLVVSEANAQNVDRNMAHDKASSTKTTQEQSVVNTFSNKEEAIKKDPYLAIGLITSAISIVLGVGAATSKEEVERYSLIGGSGLMITTAFFMAAKHISNKRKVRDNDLNQYSGPSPVNELDDSRSSLKLTRLSKEFEKLIENTADQIKEGKKDASEIVNDVIVNINDIALEGSSERKTEDLTIHSSSTDKDPQLNMPSAVLEPVNAKTSFSRRTR